MENIESIIDRIIIERNKSVDSAVIMEIQKIAIENGKTPNPSSID